jgi:hypothetical protein
MTNPTQREAPRLRPRTAPTGLALACACLLMLASSASAANFTWTGSSTTGHDWSEAENWDGTAPSGTVGTLEFPKLTSATCTAEPATAACYDTENDISGLNVSAMSFDGPYDINESCLCRQTAGEAITLGAGGLAADAPVSANLPITLSAPQTWSLNGGGVYLGSALNGSEALDLNVSGGGGVTFNGGADTGPVTVTGSNTSDTGEPAQNNGAIWVGDPDPAQNRVEEPDLNGFDANPVTVNDVALGTNDGTVGPLTVKGGDIMFGLLGAGPRLSVSGGATFDASSTMQMTINGSPAETNSSQVAANGAVDLGDAHLSLAARFTFGECDAPVGHVYTLVSATGTLEGTFAGLPDGSTVPLQRCGAPQPEMRIDYTAHAVTATVIGSTFTWTGDKEEEGEETSRESAGDWSHPANWAEGGAPSAESALGTVEFSQLSGGCGEDVFALPCYTSNNDLSGLSVQELKLDDDDDYEITGEPITLGAGGISASPVAGRYELAGEFGPGLHMPIALGASQTWHIEGQSGAGVANSGVLLDGPLTGSSDELTVDTNNGAGLLLANDTEVGSVTIQGEDISDTGYNARLNGGATEYLSASLNSSDGKPTTVKDDSLLAVGAIGPLTSTGSEVGVLALSADEARAGCYEEVPNSPSECVVPIQAGTLSLASATFDSSSNLMLAITNTEATPGVDYSDLSSTGAIDLGGATLTVDLAPTMTEASSACPSTLPTGQKYTFLSTADSLSGVFSNAPESGSEIPLDQLEGNHVGDCSPSTQKLRIEYNTLSNPQTVTGTVVEPTSSATTIPPSVAPVRLVTNEGPGAGSGTSASVTSPEPTPVPILAQRQTANVTAGTVTVRLKGTARFVSLSSAGSIPNGSEVEATDGRVVITAATPMPGRTVSAAISGGRFLIQQDHSGLGETHLTLSLPLTGCPRVTLPHGSAATRATSAGRGSGAKSRKLWVSDNGGSWGTNGRYVSTTVEGTHWLTVDECNRSRVTVAAGKVKVHDLIHNTTKILTAGKTYVAAR